MNTRLEEQPREPETPEKIWRDYFANVERERQARAATPTAATTPKVKDLVKQIWQAIFHKGGKGDIDVAKLRKIHPTAAGLTPKERRRKYISDFGRPPFYTNVKKWLDDNFEGYEIYIGPNLIEWGFALRDKSGYPVQKIKPFQRVKYPWIFQNNLESNMRDWNYALGRKFGYIDPSVTTKELEKARKRGELKGP